MDIDSHLVDSAVQDLVFLENRFKGLMAFIPVLKEIGSISNYLRESNATIEQLKVAVEELSKHKDELTLKASELDAQFTADKKSLEEKLKVIEEKASAQAQAIIDQANDKASRILFSAETRKEDLVGQIQEKEAILAGLEAKADAEEKRFNSFNSKLQKLKETI